MEYVETKPRNSREYCARWCIGSRRRSRSYAFCGHSIRHRGTGPGHGKESLRQWETLETSEVRSGIAESGRRVGDYEVARAVVDSPSPAPRICS